MANGNGETVSANAPPTVAFKTVRNTLADFKAKGVIPPSIDKRLWPNFSNTVATQLVASLKFLGLIDEAGVPGQNLKTLVESHGNDAKWHEELSQVITSAYAPVMDVELDKVHSSHLRDKFKDVFGLEGDAQRKAIAFFLFAARDAGMKLSPYLKLRERGSGRGSSGSRKKREKPPEDRPTDVGDVRSAGDQTSPPPAKPRKVHEHQMALIEILNTYTDMDTDMRKSLLDVVGFIATKGVMP